MKEINVKGNGKICVKGYKHKIIIEAFNNGHWKEIFSLKCYGSKKRVDELFYDFTNWKSDEMR